MSIPTLLDPLGKLGQHITVDLKQFRCPGLPEGYKLCSYVQPTARTCFVDTRIPSTDKVGFQITYQWDGTNPESAQGEVIIGAGDAELNTRQWINNTSTGYLHIGWGTDRHHTTTSPSQSDIPTDNSIIWGQVNFMMSNTASCSVPTSNEIQLGYDSNFSGETLYLFANHGATANNNYTLARLYRCRISDGRHVKRDFIPIRRESDGKYGLFETVEKKVYFPEQGSLTGSELSSLWDYSHFNGSEGAYIDDYPIPDSPNFVKTSGIEAGMAQIREALMIGPMIPTPPSNPNNYVGRFVPFLNLLQNSTVPIPKSATDYPKNASGFLNIPKLNRGTSNLPGGEWWQISGLFSGISYTLPLKYTFIGATTTRLTLGTKDTKYKSIYTILGSFNSLNNGGCDAPLLQQSNCDAVIYHPNYSEQVHNANLFSDIINSSVRCITPKNTSYSGILWCLGSPYIIQNIIYNFYSPIFSNTGWARRNTVFAGFTNASTKKNNRQKLYLPSLNVGSDIARPQGLDGIFLYMPNAISSIVYMLNYVRRAVAHTLVTGIDSQYFDTPIVTTEEVAETESTSDTYSKLTASTTKNEVIVTRTQVTATSESSTGKLKTTTVWTLLPNTHEKFGEECRQLREALWNTNGISHPTTGLPTSTGLLDGTIQVGTNAGTAYTSHWSLELHPIIHTWTD